MLMTFHRSLNFESATLRDRIRNAFANSLSGTIVTFVRRRNVIRIPFGINMDRFWPDPVAGAAVRRSLGLSDETFVIGAAGHFGPEKGIDIVVRGFLELIARPLPVPVALVVFGSGTAERREMLTALARSAPSAPILFPGFHRDVHQWFRAFDLFVHAPRLEAFGLVLVEAMATQLPIIATRVGGVPDIVRNGETGLLVPPEAPGELANAMMRLMGDPGLRQSMAERARVVALEEYNADRFAQRYLRVYQALLRGQVPTGVDQETGGVVAAAGVSPTDPKRSAGMHQSIQFSKCGSA
jgi:glycosyltransferase involved in cell wall biosynthesis